MSKLTPQQLREIYLKLPEDLKAAIFNVNSADIIQAIGKKYNLTIDKIGEVADETGLVMLGLTHPNNFISNLAERLKIDKESARKIAEEVNSQIFAKVRESLRKIYGIQPPPPPPLPKFTPAPPEILAKQEEKAVNPFEVKTKEIVKIPPVEKKYSDKDPYKESIE